MRRQHRQSAFSFRLMALEFRIRDMLSPPDKLLRKTGVAPGMTVLDFGCGPGGFSVAAARLVGQQGRVYALDINPLARERVKKAADRHEMTHLHVIDGDGMKELSDSSVDIVLLYDVLHEIPDPSSILAEFRRVLNAQGLLSVKDHHLKEASLLESITMDKSFRLAGSDHHALRFEPGYV